MEYKDYYKTLGVGQEASADEIKKAYRRLAKENHPDTAKGDKTKAEERFKEITEAYEVLGDQEKRRKYDEMQKRVQSGGRFDPSQFEGFGGGNDSYQTTDAQGFSDFFNMFFGGMDSSIFGAGGTRTRSLRMDGADLNGEVAIGVKEAFSGTKRLFQIGSRTIEVSIPAGIRNGGKIRVAGQGEPGVSGGRSGDLFIRVQVGAQDGLSLNGLNVEAPLDLYPWEAALGCRKTVETLDAKISVNIPAGIQTGKKIRIPGKGFPNRHGQRGEMHMRVRIVNPAVISPQAKELFQKLKEAYAKDA